MLDIKFIRQNPEKVKEACKKKGYKVNINLILDLDKSKRNILKKIEELRAIKNKASKEIASQKDEKSKNALVSKMKVVDKETEALEKKLKKIEKKINNFLLKMPNISLDWVPFGKNENDNVVLKKEGEIKKFNYPPKDYFEIAKNLDLIDVERGGKVAGTRFAYLKREFVLIEFALIHLAFDFLIEKGFVPVLPPFMLKPEMARGTGYFESSDIKEAYFIPTDNLFLIGTSEQSILTMHSGEVFREEELPKRYIAFSTCFRREAGSWGRDTKGIFRVHQFDKVEMFSFCKPEFSEKEHHFFLEIEEELMKQLKIPYRVLQICTGDLGFPAAAKYDVEAWFPAQNIYRETHSTSNCTDFQARRLNIRYRKKNGKLEFVHTVNGTVFSQRPILAIIENYQQKDGSFLIPEVLHKYLPFKEVKNYGRKINNN